MRKSWGLSFPGYEGGNGLRGGVPSRPPSWSATVLGPEARRLATHMAHTLMPVSKCWPALRLERETRRKCTKMLTMDIFGWSDYEWCFLPYTFLHFPRFDWPVSKYNAYHYKQIKVLSSRWSKALCHFLKEQIESKSIHREWVTELGPHLSPESHMGL